ncbi:predicted protein [Micromonas commoda]|uniref:Uncharacterized protein n=1 Tax=Micromonas commoda (strain RCC299 / NOUM17 / CCMP2709) TaxID=296587 RepID=C1FDZ5_MICCC|nr:predicted protein [Micromonas commoda]ACO68477.1 predicted protein [Micromonas commoda]|eukprot:XP_002507219.1 predicted protein [Micromonas commoda]
MSALTFFDGAISREIAGHKKKVHCVAWNLSGRRLASGSVDQSARVWDVEHGTCLGKELELKGHSDSVDQVCWDPTSGDRLATVSGDKSLRAWDVRSGSNCVAAINTSGENINLAWHPDGVTIAIGDREDLVSFVDTRKLRVVSVRKFPFEVNEMRWSPDGDILWVTTGTGTVEVHAWPSSRKMLSMKAHTAGCYAIDVDPLGRKLAVGGADTLVSMWDTEEYTCLYTVARSGKPVRVVRFSMGGDFIATGSEEHFIDIADSQTGACAAKLSTGAATNSLAWSPSEHILAYVGDAQPGKIDRHARTSIRIWGVPSGAMA